MGSWPQSCTIDLEQTQWCFYFDNQERKKKQRIPSTNTAQTHKGLVNKGENQLDATDSDLLVINYSSTCFGRLYAHHQEVGLRFTAYGFLSCCSCCVLESRVARCVQRVLPLRQHPLHTSCHPTLQQHNSYNRTENHRQWNAVRPPDDGRKDARNMLRNNWLPIHHYLLHLVGSRPYLLIKDAWSLENKAPRVFILMNTPAWEHRTLACHRAIPNVPPLWG